MVEAQREVARELEVLALVVTDGHPVGVVQQDVGGHEGRIGEQPGRDELGALGLVLELRHPAQLAERGRAFEDPRQLRVLVDMTLDEQRRDVGVDADGQQHLCDLEGASPQLGRILRLGERVQIDHAVERVGAVLIGHPVPERAEQVAELHITGGLDAREHASHERRC